MTDTEQSNQSCERCGCSSEWRAAFVPVKDGTRKRVCCPGCRTDLARKQARLTFWALAIGAMVVPFAVGTGRSHGFDLLVMSWLLIMIWSYLLVIPHELGHVLAARLVGAPAFAVQIGQEPWLFDRPIAGLRWRMGRYLGNGLTFHDLCEGPRSRLRSMLIALGGPLANLLIAALALVPLFSADRLDRSEWELLWFTLALASLMQLIISLWPRRISMQFGQMWSDGALALRRLRGEDGDPVAQRAVVHYMKGLLAFEVRDFAQAERQMQCAQGLLQESTLGAAVIIMRAAALSETDRAREAAELLSPLLDTLTARDGLRASAANNLAWCLLLLDAPGETARALALSDAACAVAPWEIPFQITRGCLLAISANPENGHARSAVEVLALLDGRNLRGQSAAYAELLRGLVASAEGRAADARAHHATAQSLHATAAPLRLLERRLPSP